MNNQVAIIGAGLVGSLLACFLRKQGYNVDLYEKRSDLRKKSDKTGRSINLVITSRGIHTLKHLNFWKEIEKITIPVKGRMIHDRLGKQTFYPYGYKGEQNYSVSRNTLNQLLLEKAESLGARIHFEHELSNINFESRNLTFKTKSSEQVIKPLTTFGTDGANSSCRKFLKKNSQESIEQIERLNCDYKELFLSATNSKSHKCDALHIWPRGPFMLMSLPNLDKSFTLTLYMPEKGDKISFTALKEEGVKKYFDREFNDILPLLPNIEEQFHTNPQSKLFTVWLSKWHYKDWMLLLGDASHGIVPFFGQGMNSGFEDITCLMELLNQEKKFCEKLFSDFFHQSKSNCDAIANMAIENHKEMSDLSGDPVFQRKKHIEARIEKEYPKIYHSRYSLITHSLVPYKKAFHIGEIQKQLLEELEKEFPEEIPKTVLDLKIKDYAKKL